MALYNSTRAQSEHIGTELINAIIWRYQPTINVMTQKGWDHSNSIILHGMEKIYLQNKDPKYLAYIKKFVDDFVDENGFITDLKTELDGIQPGVLCLFLYQETGELKYKHAATQLKDYLFDSSFFKTTPEGGYWHKNNDHYNGVMTIDGTYMISPFLIKYGTLFQDSLCIETGIRQTLLVASKTFNIETNLPYHGWDSNKDKEWANPITGSSPEIWSRSIGWFSMALIDMLEYIPNSHKDYDKILYLYQHLSKGIKENQNNDGMWYQLVMRNNLTDNYPETSGSGMIIYALKKGMNMGLLNEGYKETIDKGWTSLKTF
tara:strand:- start:15269 stop:16222 length:954 start_codon:yes stop_codon:yes gene_type:complete